MSAHHWHQCMWAAMLSAAACGPAPRPDGVIVLEAAPPAGPPAAASVDASARHALRPEARPVEIDRLTPGASPLADALRDEARSAGAKGKQALVMTLRGPCEPCRAVVAVLDDPAMRSALESSVLVLVDIDSFGEELGRLGFPTRTLPAFFLLWPDGTPLDAIDGGEWDDDTAANIAPVLGAFTRSQYTSRRRPRMIPRR